ncbi:MAG: DUF190 domain-containing protein [Ilumatobacteraceae bacterium]
MKLDGLQQRLTIYIGESDHHGRTPLATEIVQRAHAAGASMFRGVEGFGASNHIHTTRLLSLSDDLPMAIAHSLPELIHEGLVTVDDVEVVKYVGHAAPTAP